VTSPRDHNHFDHWRPKMRSKTMPKCVFGLRRRGQIACSAFTRSSQQKELKSVIFLTFWVTLCQDGGSGLQDVPKGCQRSGPVDPNVGPAMPTRCPKVPTWCPNVVQRVARVPTWCPKGVQRVAKGSTMARGENLTSRWMPSRCLPDASQMPPGDSRCPLHDAISIYP